MKIKTREQIPTEEIVERHGVTKGLLIGKYDNSNEIVLRLISIDVNRYIPPHTHNFPHIWKIENGTGILTDNDDIEHMVTAGQYVFIHNNEKHGIRNVGDEKLEYLCFGTIESEM